MMKSNFYDLEAKDINGQTHKMDEFEGKYILIVNTASQCGFTYQYEGLEKLYQEYKEKGLVVLGFPCNQFGEQEPKGENEIAELCKVNYGVTFPMFSKINVNGSETHPIYQYLKKQKWGILGGRINWNFTKFLVDRNGKVLKRYSSQIKPEIIEKDLIKII